MYYQPTQQIIKVNGENGARAYQMMPNSSVLLLDESNPLIYLKCTDGAGFPTISTYKLEPYQPKPQADVSELEDRIRKLEELYESYTVNDKKPK